MKVYCPYCGQRAELVDGKIVYGRSYGHKVWLCRNCMAYVRCHKGTDKPLGRLANAELRYWKHQAHVAFDPLWQYGRFKGRRNDAYKWLAEKLRLPFDRTHIGMFDVAECKRTIEICRKEKEH